MSDTGMRVGAASNQAAIVLQGAWRGLADGSLTVAQVTEMHADLAADFVKTMETIEASVMLTQSFPGTTVAPADAGFPVATQQGPQFKPVPQQVPQPTGFAPQGNVVEMPQQPQVAFAQATQPAPAPGIVPVGGSKDDVLWQEFFADPTAWYDNRQDKANGVTSKGRPTKPTSPDFKHKTEDKALWLNGKYPAPQWVQERFAALQAQPAPF